MLRHYLKITFRSLLKYKHTAFINLFGLTLGFACCLLIVVYVLHETSYDRYNAKAERTFRVTRDFLGNSGEATLRLASVAPPIGPLLQHDFPEIEKETVLLPAGNNNIKYGDNIFVEKNVFIADAHLFEVFDGTVLSGSIKSMEQPFSLMMEAKTAEKYFGTENPIDKRVRVGGKFDCRVVGTFQAWPAAAHIHPQILLSFNTLRDPAVYGEEQLKTNWGNNAFLTYVVLPQGYSAARLEAQMPAFIDRHHPRMGNGDGQKQSKFTKLHFEPLTDIHLRSHRDDEVEPPGDIVRVYTFSAIAFFILLIACINYMNLSTARAMLRAKEIGVRKVVGAQRREITLQFLGESVVMTYLALVLATGVAALTVPLLSQLAATDLLFSDLWRWEVALALPVVALLVGLLSGIYPALFMSAFRPNLILKGIFKAGRGSMTFRRVLVVVQFAISIILIITTGVVFRQLSFIRNKSLGFDKNQVIVLPYGNTQDASFGAFREQLLQKASVHALGRSTRIPSGRLLDDMGAQVFADGSLMPTRTPIKYVQIDDGFMAAYGIGVKAGRNFHRDFPADTTRFILNEAAVRMIGWKSAQDAIGKPMTYGRTKGNIVGVVRDFHFESLHQAITPMVFLLDAAKPGNSGFGNLSIKLTGTDLTNTLADVEATWKQLYPETPFTYTFLDENFQRLYDAEQRQGLVFTVFACIAVFVACLGLLGLTAFAVTQRVKEIGIRKVLGASVANIAGLLSKDFLRLIVIASLIAFPVAWYAMHRWLEGFAYRIGIPWWVFVLSGTVTLVVALLTVIVQTLPVATANPVKSLRTE